MTFSECVLLCFDEREFVAAFDRLRGTNLMGKATSVERLVDAATGYDAASSSVRHDELVQFVAFVYEVVWSRVPPEGDQ